MPMATAANQVPLGQQLYLFDSPVPGTTDCIIWGHGAHLFGDGHFILPANTTLHCTAPAGQNVLLNPVMSIRGPNGPRHAPPLQTYNPGSRVPNYRLSKALGSSLKGIGTTYGTVSNTMGMNVQMDQNNVATAENGWCPHFVSIRRRFQGIGKTILLSDVITDVQAHNNAIVVFHYLGCRGDYSGNPFLTAIIRALKGTVG